MSFLSRNRGLVITALALALLLAVVAAFYLLPPLGRGLWEMSEGGKKLFPLITVAALIDSINPCAISVLAVTLVLLFSLKKSRREMITIGGLYIAGLFAAYFLIGLGLLEVLHLFSTPHFVGKVAAAVLGLMGLGQVIGVYYPNIGRWFRIPSIAHGSLNRLMGQATPLAALALGALVGLCEFPCTGGPYLAAVGLLYDGATYWQGVLYLLWYNLLFVLPLILVLLIAGDEKVLTRVQAWKNASNKGLHLIVGVAMIIFASLIWYMGL